MLGAAAHLRDVPGVPPNALAAMAGTLRVLSAGTLDDRFDAERIEAAARERLGSEAFEAAFTAGAAAAVDDLIAT
jgi:hypothetical protein